jgi:adenosylcobinamide-GDP ribazoletransferase
MNEIRTFLAALMFFTRIPVKLNNPADLNRASRYFPLVGIIVGLIGAFFFGTAIFLFKDNLIASLFALAATLLTTGAFHEDGLADVADAFGGGWTKSRILEIMKDSRVGAFGVIALIVVIGLKIVLQARLSLTTTQFLLLYVSAHSVSRLMPVFMIRFMHYAREDDNSKSKPLATRISNTGLLIAIISALLPFAAYTYFTTFLMWLSIIPCILLTIYLGWYFNKWIDGYTGDCLGATQQLTEIIFYLTILAIWRFTLHAI